MESTSRDDGVTLFADLEYFLHDHRAHGPLTADATEPAWNGVSAPGRCPCGVVFERWVTPEDAELDLLHAVSAELSPGSSLQSVADTADSRVFSSHGNVTPVSGLWTAP
jgi:hypothetical protein